MALGVQGRGKSQKPECVCPLSLYVDQLSLVLSVSLSSGILCWCWCKDFGSKVREGRSLPALPFLGRALSCCLPLAWPESSSLLAVTFSLQGLRGTPAFPGLRGSGYSYHYCASLTHMPPASGNRYDEPFIHLPFECLLLSKFNSECFKKESQNGIPQDGNKRGTAAVIGSIRTTSPPAPHPPPPKRGPISASWP